MTNFQPGCTSRKTLLVVFSAVFIAMITFIDAGFTQPVLRSAITGTVLDQQSMAPLPGATVIIPGTDPVIGE